MANPNFYKGMKALPGAGRPRNSSLTIKGKVENWLRGVISQREFKKLYNGMKEQEKLNMILQLMRYCVAPVQADSLSPEEIEQLYSRLEKQIKPNVETKKAG